MANPSRNRTCHYNMNFTLLPTDDFFVARSIFASIDKTLQARLTSLPSVLERAQSSVMFAEQAKHGEHWVAAAYLRASLADFVSMEEIQTLDATAHTPLRIRHSSNPLVHLLALMRHLNIHVKSVATSQHTVSASVWDQPFEMDLSVISNLALPDLQGLRNAKYYSTADLNNVVAWFAAAQLHWGVGYIFRVGVEAFASEIAHHHGL